MSTKQPMSNGKFYTILFGCLTAVVFSLISLVINVDSDEWIIDGDCVIHVHDSRSYLGFSQTVETYCKVEK